MNTFKPGDRVVCVGAWGNPSLTDGRIYTVRQPSKYLVLPEDANMVWLEEVGGGWYPERFVLAWEGLSEEEEAEVRRKLYLRQGCKGE